MSFLSSRALRSLFAAICPFYPDGQLRPKPERKTLLAANVNVPVELQGKGFVMAAVEGNQSPLLIQLSFNALLTMGGHDTTKGNSTHELVDPYEEKRMAMLTGAFTGKSILGGYVRRYGAKWIGLTLDHFHVPPFSMKVRDDHADVTRKVDEPDVKRDLYRDIAYRRLVHASRCMAKYFGDEAKLDSERVDAYANYLVSSEYKQFKANFLEAIRVLEPAWAMIDTERLPPLLDFVVTRDIVDALRTDPSIRDVMIEAEFGATGSSGKPVEYVPLRGRELEEFAQQVVQFVRYTGADGISYPIGMSHAAKKAERYFPDVVRLETVQKALFLGLQRYIPFAQHGGTGAAELATGLVGKNNVNTYFLVVMANAMADYVEGALSQIRAGDKSAAAGVSARVINAVKEAVVGKLKECNTWQAAVFNL